MKQLRSITHSIALALVIFSTTASADNLLEVYHQALLNDPTFKEAEATWLAAKQNIPIAAANLLPALDANAGVSRIYSDLGGSTTNSNATEYSLTVGQPLINFAYWANLRGAQASTKAAAATYAAAAQDLMVRTVQAYVAVVQADDDLRFTLAQKRAIKEQLINAKQKYEAGITAITGVYQAQASYDAIIATEITNRTTLANNLQNLKAITGHDYALLKGILRQVPLASPNPQRVDDWIEITREQNPQIKAQQYTSIAARENIKQQQAGFIPTVSANGSYNYSSASQSLGAETDKNATVGVNVNFPFYSGGATLAQTRQARYQYVNASAALEYTYRSMVNQTTQAFLTILSMISQIKADVIAVKSAEASYKATQLGYVAGTQPMLNVLEDLSNVYSARQDYVDDQYTYVNSIILLKQAAGTLDFNDLRQINQWLNNNKAVARDSAIHLIANTPSSIKTSSYEGTIPTEKKLSSEKIASKSTSNSFHYTLQVAAVETQEQAEQFIQQYPAYHLQSFSREANGKNWISIGYGSYNSTEAAQQALRNLPYALNKFNPWIAKINNHSN